MRKNSPSYIAKLIANIASLGLFTLLLLNGRLQLWFIIFIAAAVLSIFLGRFYCGWICPMQTIFRPVNWIYNKLGLKRFNAPAIFRNQIFSYTILVLFLASMVILNRMRISIPPLALITGIAVVVTLIIKEEFWHSHVCPFGTILRLSSAKTLRFIQIDAENCTDCGKCMKVCNAEAVSFRPEEAPGHKYFIQKNKCLICLECQVNCPAGAISYSGSRPV